MESASETTARKAYSAVCENMLLQAGYLDKHIQFTCGRLPLSTGSGSIHPLLQLIYLNSRYLERP